MRILTDDANERPDDFSQKPPEFIGLSAAALNATKRRAVLDGIRYQRVGDGYYYAQELFEEHERRAYLRNKLDATKSVPEKVVFDSAGIEQHFARELEQNEALKVSTKLPSWFTIPTPLGSYNPDRAVLLDCAEGEASAYIS